MFKSILKLALLFLLFPTAAFGQIQSGKMSEIKELVMKSNDIQTVLYNYGSISTPGALADVKDFVWNGLGYMYEFGTMIAAEVVNNNGDTLHIVSDSFVSRREGDYNPDRTIKWGWLPESGYSNTDSFKIANSIDISSWYGPWSFWPGEYGNGVTVALNEAYYKMNDFTNAEFNYYPFVNDSTKRGLGVSAVVRVYQFGGGLKDAIIVKYFIKNESDKDLNKVYFGFFGDPHIGGVGDVKDDRVHILNNNIITLWDDDFIGRAGKHPGYLSFKLLETPGNKNLTSFHVMPWADHNNVPKNDSFTWGNFNDGIDTLAELYNNGGDNVISFGTGPFTLNKGETKIVKLAIFCSYNIQDVNEDAKYISLQHNWATMRSETGESGGDNNYKINLKSVPNIVNGEIEVTWNYMGNNSDAKVFLEYSNNKGDDWFPLAYSLDNNGSFVWNTEDVNDGMNYILRIVAYNEDNPKEYYYDISTRKFTVDNPDENAKPELTKKITFENTTVTSTPLKINWISEDADNAQLNVKLAYSFSKEGHFTEIISTAYTNGENSYDWDIKNIPNAKECYLKITISDGVSDSTLISEPFTINIFESQLSQSHVKSYRGNATPKIIIQTVDNTLLTKDEYGILFHVNDDEKTFDIKNVSRDEILISNQPVNEFVSTPEFDGMKVTIKDMGNDINNEKTKFVSNNSGTLDFKIEFPPVLGADKIKVDDDYLIAFNNFDTLSDGSWKYADTMETLLGRVLAPFSIWNIKDITLTSPEKEKATFILYEPYQAKQKNGRWDIGEVIILQPQGTTDPTTSYQISFNITNTTPGSGDSLFIITYNQIEDNDEFRFSLDSTVVDVKDINVNNNFELKQNYPNPFNPATTIEYSIPQTIVVVGSTHALTIVKLKVYDILGREVATLVNKKQKPGTYKIIFDASKLSSGIYFYRLSVGNFVKTNKMILIK